jgi:hypothetical protein
MMSWAGRAVGLALILTLVASHEAAAQPPDVDAGAKFVVFTGANRDFPFADFMGQGFRAAGLQDIRIEQESADQWLIGINAAGHAGRFVLGFAELILNDAGTFETSARTGSSPASPRVSLAAQPRFLELTGGAHVQIPVRTWRVRPFFGGGAGLMRGRLQFMPGGEELTEYSNDFLFHLEAGLRVLFTRYVGVSVEFRSVQLTREPQASFNRFLIGALFRVD